MSPPVSASRYILRSRLLRGAFISLVISGIGISITIPQITLFLVGELHLTDAQAGLYFLTNLTAPIVGYVVGSLSDRAGSRLLVFRLSALAGFAGWVLMAVAMQAWMPFAINAILLSAAGAGAAQLQAAVRDELNRSPTPADNEVVAVIRMAMAFGWIVGPVLGAVLGAVIGLRPLLLVTGISVLLSLVPLIGVRTDAVVRDVTPTRSSQMNSAARAAHPRSMLPLVVFTGIYVLIMCGETVKLAYLPLYMDGDLRVDAGVRGAVIGLQPLVELLLMPIAAKLASRFGFARVLIVGAMMAVAAHVSYASAGFVVPHLVPLVIGQLLMAGVIATFGVLGITVAQRLVPTRVGMASSVFLSAYAINAAVGGFAGSVGSSWLGIPQLFWIPAVIATLGVIALVVLNARVPLDAGTASASIPEQP
ncbi:MFS transporter [Microbacterium sp. EST19A]|uniref:MFS transporter n=1 Tax=Microbacterium sp. EST19A TaxID=2862681 RepID=UPI001CC08CB6|nr:MFS transporter [Microbacterium sp. EST19A]